MNFTAFRLFATDSKQTRNVAVPETRRLRLEALEDRALLSVSDVPVFCGPPTYEAWLAQQNLLAETQTTSISSAVVSASANNSDNASLYLVSDVEDSQTESAALQDVYSQYLNEGFIDEDDLDEFIEVVGVTFLNGDSDNDDSDSDDFDEGGTRDAIDWPLDLQYVLHSTSNTSVSGVQNAMLESYGMPDPSLAGNNQPQLFDPDVVGDYLKIFPPTLPVNYMGTIAVSDQSSGSSITYKAYSPSGYEMSLNGGVLNYYGGFSGGATWFYLVPVNDAAPTTNKTIEVSLQAPTCLAPSGGATYNFSYVNQTVSTTIVDDDHWKISMQSNFTAPLGEGGVVLPYVLNEGIVTNSDSFASFTLSRSSNGTDLALDKSYPINVTITLPTPNTNSDPNLNPNGAPQEFYADSNDFTFSCSADSGTTWTDLTPSGRTVVATIPSNRENVLFRVHAHNDSLIERANESLKVSLNSQANNSLPYPIESLESDFTIRDSDVLTLETVQFLDIQQLRPDPVPDLNSPLNNPLIWSGNNIVHWTKGNASATLPIAYVSDDTLKVKVRFSGNIDPSIDNIIVRYHVAGISEGAWSDWKDVSEDANGLYVDNFDWVSNFANFLYESSIALSVPSLTLSWQMAVATAATSVNSGLEEIANESQRNVLGESHNPLYVLYDDPIQTSPLYLTLVHTACTAANGQYTESYVFDAVWNKIKSKSIQKTILQNGSVFETTMLSYYGKDVVYPSHKQYVTASLSVTDDGNGGYLIEQSASRAREVALWYKNNHPNDPLKTFGYSTEGLLYYLDGTCGSWQNFAKDLFGCQGIVVTKVNVVYTNTKSQQFQVKTNLLGQGGLAPRENTWHDHSLIKYNNTIYDPSYGVCYGTCVVGENDAKHNFIAKLNSLGTRSNLSPDYYGYEHKYEPTTIGQQISVNDLIFSWDPPSN